MIRTASGRSIRTLAIAILALAPLHGCAGTQPSELELGQLAGVLRLHPGMRVADVGAGKGEWSEALARRVGAGGRVFATEVDEEDLDDIRRRVDDAGLANVTTVLGNDHEIGLPDRCCDAILLRLVYHHFTEPREMRASLARALRSGGQLAVVEITPQRHWAELEGVPDRGGHGISPEDLLDEMESDGWIAVERHDDWGDEEDHYCVVFQQAAR